MSQDSCGQLTPLHWCVDLQETAPTTSSCSRRFSPCPGKWPCWTAPWWLRRSSTTRRNRTTSPGTTWGRAGRWAQRPVESWRAEKLCGSSTWRWATQGNTSPSSGADLEEEGSHPLCSSDGYMMPLWLFPHQNFDVVLQTDLRAGGGAAGAGGMQEAEDGSSDPHQRRQWHSVLSAAGLHGQTGELQRFLFAQVVQSEWDTVQFVTQRNKYICKVLL